MATVLVGFNKYQKRDGSKKGQFLHLMHDLEPNAVGMGHRVESVWVPYDYPVDKSLVGQQIEIIYGKGYDKKAIVNGIKLVK